MNPRALDLRLRKLEVILPGGEARLTQWLEERERTFQREWDAGNLGYVQGRLEKLKASHPEWYEPGGPATLPPLSGGMGNEHYARDLTEEEIALEEAWYSEHRPDAFPRRYQLTEEEIEQKGKTYERFVECEAGAQRRWRDYIKQKFEVDWDAYQRKREQKQADPA